MNLKYISSLKVFTHAERVSEWLTTGTTLPVTFEMDPTNVCNHLCPNCAGGRFMQKSLSWEFMKKVIDQIADFAKGLVLTGGGEIFCNPETPRVIQYAKSKGISVGVITHGGLISKEIAKIVVDCCEFARVSVDHATPEAFLRTHGKDEEESRRVWNGAELLANARAQNTDSVCVVGTACLTREGMIPEMRPFVIRSKGISVSYAQFRPFHLNTCDIRPQVRDLKQEFDERPSFMVFAPYNKYQDMEKRTRKVVSYPVCHGDHFRTVICADGKLYANCFMRGFNHACIGDLNKHSFKDLWFGDTKTRVFNELLGHYLTLPMCYHEKISIQLDRLHKLHEQGEQASVSLKLNNAVKQGGVHLNFV